MKTLILSLLLLFFGFINSLHAEDACFDPLVEHVELIESTEEYLAVLGNHSKAISAFEITQLQKTLTKRFLSLKNVLKTFKETNLNCSPAVLATAIAIYDFSRIGKSIFANTELRRVVLGFSKYTRYQLTDFVAFYKNILQMN